ncbi:hypothetical protein WJX73_002358 [Symbiochloris irregularis]|uniref:Enhancer of mRNA-decapping protein 4 C-terminal domain-containing protein n=1 Tax=Symbiochloris irregularis TaxID=706552 RepID=A0AAW1P8H6_9CHLO
MASPGPSRSLEQKLAASVSRAASTMSAAVAAGASASRIASSSKFGGQLLSNNEEATFLAQRSNKDTVTQLETVPITRMVTDNTLELRHQIAASESFICYGLRQGHIRVLHRQSAGRLLLRAHFQPITDLRFCPMSENMFASASQDGIAAIWQLREEADGTLGSICHLKVCLKGDTGTEPIRSLTWHPTTQWLVVVAVGRRLLACHFSPDQEDIEEEVDVDPNADIDKPGALSLPVEADGPITSVVFSEDGLLLAIGGHDGQVRLAKLAATDASLDDLLAQLQHTSLVDGQLAVEGEASGSLAWVGPRALVSGTHNNAALRLWHVDEHSKLQLRHMLTFAADPAGTLGPLNHLSAVADAGLLVLGNARWEAMYIVHLDEDRSAFDSVAEFRGLLPVISLHARWDPHTAVFQLFCIQTEAVQQYTLRPEQCIPADGNKGREQLLVTPTQLMREARLAASRSNSQASILSELHQDEFTSRHSRPESPLAQSTFAATSEESGSHEGPGTGAGLPSPFDSSGVSQVKILKRQGPGMRPPLAPEAPRAASPTQTVLSSAPPAPIPAESAPTASASNSATAPTPLDSSTPSSTHLQLPTNAPPPPSFAAARPTAAAAAAAATKLKASRAENKALMEGLHRDVAKELAAGQQRSLKSIKEEVKKEGKRLEAAHEAQVAKANKAHGKALAEERRAVLQEEHQHMERLLAAISASINRDLPERLETILKAQLARLPPPLAPQALQSAVAAALATSLPGELSGSAMQSCLEKALNVQLKAALRAPLKESFRTSFEQQLLPAFDAACQNLFSQVQATFAGGLAEHLQAAGGANAQVASSLQAALGQAQATAELLANDVAEGQRTLIRLAAANAAESASPGRTSTADAVDIDPKVQLTQLINQERYEDAFHKVLESGDVELVEWLCGEVDPGDVCSREPVPLSQGVLLSLLAQLSMNLMQDTSAKLEWMRETAMVIDPEDPTLNQHMRTPLQGVFGQLKDLGPKLSGKDASLHRTVTHLVNALLHRLKY